jgi:protein-S-isoprenylcysteine O-methyltransferase Ste14
MAGAAGPGLIISSENSGPRLTPILILGLAANWAANREKKSMAEKAVAKKVAAYSAIVFFFVMALEVVIMISPFAFFFYSVFAPFLNFLSQHAALKWTTMFFLPHMILPPTLFLKAVRVLGSVLFLVGCFAFIVCALQVYLGKIFNWGLAARGLYHFIRHPQYLSLGLWGSGMAILWPRFIVLVTLSIMLILYYFLAKDEEGRMLRQYGASYQEYQKNTGMFLPRRVENVFSPLVSLLVPANSLRYIVIPSLLVIAILGTGFLLREITVRSLPCTSKQNLMVVPILPEDARLGEEVASGLLQSIASGKMPFVEGSKDYLGYLMPVDYVMQGMIADTGGHFHLFKRHHTVGLITDWVLHPFEHLRRPPAAHLAAMHGVAAQVARRHHCPLEINDPGRDCATCSYRRVILVKIDQGQGTGSLRHDLFSLTASRTPVCFIDLDTRDGKILQVRGVNKGSAWKDVPTPEM